MSSLGCTLYGVRRMELYKGKGYVSISRKSLQPENADKSLLSCQSYTMYEYGKSYGKFTVACRFCDAWMFRASIISNDHFIGLINNVLLTSLKYSLSIALGFGITRNFHIEKFFFYISISRKKAMTNFIRREPYLKQVLKPVAKIIGFSL